MRCKIASSFVTLIVVGGAELTWSMSCTLQQSSPSVVVLFIIAVVVDVHVADELALALALDFWEGCINE